MLLKYSAHLGWRRRGYPLLSPPHRSHPALPLHSTPTHPCPPTPLHPTPPPSSSPLPFPLPSIVTSWKTILDKYDLTKHKSVFVTMQRSQGEGWALWPVCSWGLGFGKVVSWVLLESDRANCWRPLFSLVFFFFFFKKVEVSLIILWAEGAAHYHTTDTLWRNSVIREQEPLKCKHVNNLHLQLVLNKMF